MKKAILLDRDGTLIKEKHYLHKPEDVEFEDLAIKALQKAIKHGYLLILITNQAGIGRGLYAEKDFWTVQDHIKDELANHQITLHDTFFCPHHPTKGIGKYKIDSPDRKPNPGMLLSALQKHQLTPHKTLMIGDKSADINAAHNAQLDSVLVNTGYGKDFDTSTVIAPPTYRATDLLDAINWTLTHHDQPQD